MPHRVSVEYVKVGLDEVLAKVQDEVSEEEILAYYEEHKRRDEQMHAADDLPLPDPDLPDQADSAESAATAQEGHKEGASANDSAVPDSDRTDAKQAEPQDIGPQEKAPDEAPGRGPRRGPRRGPIARWRSPIARWRNRLVPQQRRDFTAFCGFFGPGV